MIIAICSFMLLTTLILRVVGLDPVNLMFLSDFSKNFFPLIGVGAALLQLSVSQKPIMKEYGRPVWKKMIDAVWFNLRRLFQVLCAAALTMIIFYYPFRIGIHYTAKESVKFTARIVYLRKVSGRSDICREVAGVAIESGREYELCVRNIFSKNGIRIDEHLVKDANVIIYGRKNRLGMVVDEIIPVPLDHNFPN